MRLKKRLLAFSRRLHARIRKTRYMHKMRCLLINRRSLLLALRLLWKTPIFPSNSRFPRLCAKFFFFQAEDGIRDGTVTGVQTCALPIWTLEDRVEERTHELDRRRQVAEALRDILATLNSHRSLDEILSHIVSQAGRLLGCEDRKSVV